MNWQLLSAMFTIASGVTIGIFMTVALVTGFDEIGHIIIVCLAGLVLSIPIAWIVTKKMQSVGIVTPKEVSR